MRTCGVRMCAPAPTRPTGSPSQRIKPSLASTKASSTASWTRVARPSISEASAFCAAALSARAASPEACGSGVKRKPLIWPTCWPSTITSPPEVISASIIAFSRNRRMRTLVRRSTNRCASRSCKASDRLSSTRRVTPCQCSGSRNQSGRLAINVQVRTWAMRAASASRSPSTRSTRVDVAGEPFVGDAPGAHHEAVHGEHQLRVGGRRELAVVGDLAAFPQPRDVATVASDLLHVGVARRDLQRHLVGGERRAGEARFARQRVERGGEARQRSRVEVRAAPLQHPHGVEAVVLQRLHQLAVEGQAAAGGAEGAVAHVAAGAPGDLPELGRVQAPVVPAVELLVGGEGDVVDVEVEAHADGVGGDDVVDVAVLVEVDLRVAGARRQRAQHHGGAALLPSQPFGDGVDLLRREGDDGRAARQARDLLLAGEGELGHARSGDELGARQQLKQRLLHGGGADEQRLVEAAAVQQPIGEDVAAVEVGGELHLVDRHKGEVEVARHRLHRAHPVAGVARFDLLLAGDERHRVGADLLDHAVVDFAREQAQRQADHAGAVRQHALDGEMRLAGVGGPEHQGDAGGAVARGPCGAVAGGRRGREREVHQGVRCLERSRTLRGRAWSLASRPPSARGLAPHQYHIDTADGSRVYDLNAARTNRARIDADAAVSLCSRG